MKRLMLAIAVLGAVVCGGCLPPTAFKVMRVISPEYERKASYALVLKDIIFKPDTLKVLKKYYSRDFEGVETPEQLQQTDWATISKDDRSLLIRRLRAHEGSIKYRDLLPTYASIMDSLYRMSFISRGMSGVGKQMMGQGAAGTDMFSTVGAGISSYVIALQVNDKRSAKDVLTHLERNRGGLSRAMTALAASHRDSPREEIAQSHHHTELFMSNVRKMIDSGNTSQEAMERVGSPVSDQRQKEVEEDLSAEKSEIWKQATAVREDSVYLSCRQLLAPGDLYLAISMDLVWTYVVSAWKDGDSLRTEIDTIRTMQGLIANRIGRFAHAVEVDSAAVPELSKEISQQLLGEVVSQRIAKSKRLIVAPDGVFWSLPFSALTVDNKYVGAQVPILHVLSLDDLRSGKSSGKGALVVADPVAPAERDSINPVLFPGWPGQLEYAAEEGKFVAGLLKTKVITASAANEAAVRAKLPAVRIIHFACHGYSFPAQPLLMSSALLLSSSDNDTTWGGDGYLKAYEVHAEVPLVADLVVLAACYSGRPVLPLGTQAGMGVFGLPLGFRLAGAKSVVSSRWKIDDQEGFELMKDFYREIANGRRAEDALRATIAKRADSTKYRVSQWAGFYVLGSGKAGTGA